MKKIVSVILLSLFSFCAFAEKTIDGIVAIVNDEIITRSELNQNLNLAKAQLAYEHLAIPAEPALQKQILDQTINKKLQLQAARNAHIEVSAHDVENAVQTIADHNHVTIKTLYDKLAAEGMSVTKYQQELRDQIALERVQQQEIISRIVIQPSEVDQFMQSKSWQTNGDKEYRLKDILIPLPSSPNVAQLSAARNKAADIIKKIEAGADFDTVAQSQSSDARALKGGDLGFRKLPEIPTAFVEYVIKMNPNDIEGPIQTPNGFHIIRLTAVKNSDNKQTNLSHEQVQQYLMQNKFEEGLANWVLKLRAEAFIKVNLG